MRIHVRLPGDADPQKQLFEITTREQVFAPTTPCFNYIRVKNLKMFHAANGVPIPPPQRGLLSATRGHHWIIEGCEIGYANTLGADLGGQWWSLRTGEVQGYTFAATTSTTAAYRQCRRGTTRRMNTCWSRTTLSPIARQCPSPTITSQPGSSSTAPSIRSYGATCCSTHPTGRGSGSTGNPQHADHPKPHRQHPPAHWGAVFLEINKGPNLIDNNLILNSGGNGIYEHDAERVVSMQNLVAVGTGTAVYLRFGDPGRVNPPLENNHRVYGNLLAGFPVAINRPNPTTLSDFNLISVTNGVSPFTQFSWGAKKVEMDLAAWHAQGEDTHSQIADIAIQFDPKTLTLAITSSVPLPIPFPELPEVLPGVALAKDLLTFDFLGQPRQPGRFEAGPLARVPTGRGAVLGGPETRKMMRRTGSTSVSAPIPTVVRSTSAAGSCGGNAQPLPGDCTRGWLPRRVEGRNGSSAGRRWHGGSAHRGVSGFRALGGAGPAAATGAVADDAEGPGTIQPAPGRRSLSDEFMMFQHPVKGSEESGTEALVAGLQGGLEPLGAEVQRALKLHLPTPADILAVRSG